VIRMSLKGVIPLAAVLGCMHVGAQSGAASTVADTDVGRLGPGQEGLVNQARQALDGARDALSRTRLGVQQAQNEEGTARADLQAAEADQKVADAQQKVANDSRAPDAVEKAHRLQEQAKAHKLVAGLHIEYASKLLGEREAEAQAAERQVKVAQARVEWSKLQALEQAGNPAATKYDPGRFQSAVNDAQAQLDETTRDARNLEVQATAARQRWEDTRRRLSADAGSNPSSAGSGQ
jgi:hypothetical protein